jgi:acetolactate synthase-1/2/3 large subunit
VDVLKTAIRPVVVIGAAANRQTAIRAIRDFVEETNIYWCSTQMGKGIIDERHRSFLGCAALSDKDFVHGALDYADVILMLGHDETEKPPFIMRAGSKRKVIHISFNPVIVDNVYWPGIQVVGDIANAVWQIHEALRSDKKTWDQPFFRRYKELTDPFMLEGTDDKSYPMNVCRVVADIRKALPDDGIISLDNGLYKVVVARLFKAFGPNTVLLDNALATMGAGIPNAIACKLLYPDKAVVSISGDGGSLMNMPELATCAQYGINVVHIVLNDNAFGMIKWKQGTGGFPVYGLDLQNPDFVKLAEAYGAHGHRVEKTEDFVPLLKRCIESKGTHVIEVPHSYDCMSAQLKEIPAKIEKVQAQVESELGECFKECSIGGQHSV